MVDKTINDLTAATAVAAGDLFEIEQSAASKKATIEHIRAAVLTPRGALVRIATDLPAQNYSAGSAIPFPSGSEIYDTDNVHDNTTNNSRLTVPSGVTYVRVSGGIGLSSDAAGNWNFGGIQKNGSFEYAGCPSAGWSVSTVTAPTMTFASPPLSVTPGDYFDLFLHVQDNSLAIEANGTWFCLEILA